MAVAMAVGLAAEAEVASVEEDFTPDHSHLVEAVATMEDVVEAVTSNQVVDIPQDEENTTLSNSTTIIQERNSQTISRVGCNPIGTTMGLVRLAGMQLAVHETQNLPLTTMLPNGDAHRSPHDRDTRG